MPARKRQPNMRAVISISLPPDTGRLLGRAAGIRHQSLSGFIRDVAVREANRVLGIEPTPAPQVDPTPEAIPA